MNEFFAIALGYPTVLFTIPLIVLVVYWLTVIAGIVDVDALGGVDAAAGKLEGALDAAAGKLEGALDAAAGKVEGALDAVVAKGASAEAVDGSLAALLSALRLRRAPVTVVLTVLVLCAWSTCFLGALYLVPILPLPDVLAGALVCLLSLVVAWPIAGVVTYPMGPLFKTHPAPTHADLVGRRVVIATSRVDERFGEAELADGGAGLLLQVRALTPNELVKGSEAVLVAWHAEHGAFDVASMHELLEGGSTS